MIIFVFPFVGELTDSYHSSGGMVIVAESREQAQEMIDRYNSTPLHEWEEKGPDCMHLTEGEWKNAVMYPTSTCEPRMFVFPDAGCC